MPRPATYLGPAAIALALCALLWVSPGSLTAAEAGLSQDFNGPETVWQIPATDRKPQVLSHECAAGGARDQAGLERIVIAAPGGESVHLVCSTAQAAVIDELDIGLWLKSNLPGAQLGARITLPRTPDRESALTTVTVFGTNYDRPGNWQQLVLKDLPKLLAAELRVLRLTAGKQVDAKEAYLDAVVLSVPGDPQGVVIETDELVVDGVPRVAVDDVKLVNYPTGSPGSAQRQLQLAPAAAQLRQLPNFAAASPVQATPDSIQLQGDLLLANDRPLSVRAVDWHGEPLDFLAQRGFNVVRLQQPPTTEQAAEAQRTGMWFICRPPRPDVIEQNGIGNPSDRVAGWYLLDAAMENDPHYARRWAELIRAHDAVSGRPIMIEPQTDWAAASLTADVLLAGRERSGLIAPADYEQWLATAAQSTRPGTAIWAHIPTQFDPIIGRQIAALIGTPSPPPNTGIDQLEVLTKVACTHGVRGFVFSSQLPLNGLEPDARRRALSLELINRRLQLIEPWLAGGKVIGRTESADAAWNGNILVVDRARLILPMRSAAHTAATSRDSSFIVPGISESSQVFMLTPASLKALPTQRVAGGIRFSLKPSESTYILLTENPQVIQSLRQRIARDGPRYMQLLRESVVSQALMLADGTRRLSAMGVNVAGAASAIANVDAQIRQVDSLLASGGIGQAEQAAMAVAELIQRAAAELKSQTLQSPILVSNPLAVGGERLPEFVSLQRSSSAFARGDNLVYGGDFEDLGQMTQLGWKHFRNEVAGAQSRAELSTAEPRHGNSCLLLQNVATSGTTAASVTDAPVWIQSPPIPIADAGWIEITGWVRIDQAITGSPNGLQIVDSIGGPDLAISVRSTPGWQRFQMIRAVTEPTEVRLTFALAGIGAARIDAVMLRPLQQPTPPATPIVGAPPLNVRPVGSTGPLLVVPQAR